MEKVKFHGPFVFHFYGTVLYFIAIYYYLDCLLFGNANTDCPDERILNNNYNVFEDGNTED